MIDMSLMDMVLLTLGVLLTMALLSCLCCVCMKFSDLKMKSYVIELAKKRGIQLDLDSPHSRNDSRSPYNSDNCTIMVPDFGMLSLSYIKRMTETFHKSKSS